LDSKASQKLMAELLRRGATLLREPCPNCGGILLRYGGREICLACEDITSMEDLEVKLPSASSVPSHRIDVVNRVLDDTLARLERERDPAKRVKILQAAKLSAELLKALKEMES
jgi:UPF0148 protein